MPCKEYIMTNYKTEGKKSHSREQPPKKKTSLE